MHVLQIVVNFRKSSNFCPFPNGQGSYLRGRGWLWWSKVFANWPTSFDMCDNANPLSLTWRHSPFSIWLNFPLCYALSLEWYMCRYWIEWDCIRFWLDWLAMGEWSVVRQKGHWIPGWGFTVERTRTLTTDKGTRDWLQQVGSRVSPSPLYLLACVQDTIDTEWRTCMYSTQGEQLKD